MRRNSAPGNQAGMWRTEEMIRARQCRLGTRRTNREKVYRPEFGHDRNHQLHVFETEVDQICAMLRVEVVPVGNLSHDLSYNTRSCKKTSTWIHVWDRDSRSDGIKGIPRRGG